MLSDEELADLLDDYHAATTPAARAEIEHRILTVLTKYFEQVLRPALRREFGHSAQDTSVRYTAMVNGFFQDVLAKRPDQFWKAQSLRALRAFASQAIANDIRDVLRRQRRRVSLDNDALCELANSRATHFKNQHTLDLEPVLSRLQAWITAGGKHERGARVLLHRYSDGMTYDQVAEQMGIAKKTVYNLKAETLKELRRDLT